MLRQDLSGLGTPNVCSDLASLSKAFQQFIIRSLSSKQRLLPTPLETEDNCFEIAVLLLCVSLRFFLLSNISFWRKPLFQFSLFTYFLASPLDKASLGSHFWNFSAHFHRVFGHQGAAGSCWCLWAWIGHQQDVRMFQPSICPPRHTAEASLPQLLPTKAVLILAAWSEKPVWFIILHQLQWSSTRDANRYPRPAHIINTLSCFLAILFTSLLLSHVYLSMHITNTSILLLR